MWVGYVRVSQLDGRSGDSFRSVKDQRAAIQRWAKGRGVAVEILPEELDESGGRDDRPIFMQAVEGIEAGRYEGIVAFDQSRLHRETIHLLVMVDAVLAAGGEVEVTEGDVDWETPEGRFFGTVQGAMHEHQRRNAQRKFKHYTASAVERGIWKMRQTPLGYMKDGLTRRLVPSPDAPKVKRAFKMRMEGASHGTIAPILEMTPAGARHLLGNRVYLGEIKVGEFVQTNCHPPLVDQATFDAVRAMRSIRPARSKSGEISLLAGLIRCESCGHIMPYGHSYERAYYQCRIGQKSTGVCPRRAGVTAGLVEPYIEEVARAALEGLKISTARKTENTAHMRDEIVKAESELAAYLSATRAAGLSIETYAQGARERQDAVDVAKAALEQHHTLSPLGGTFDTGAELWDELNSHERNRLLRGLLDCVVVRPAGRGSKVSIADRVRLFEHGTLPGRFERGENRTLPVRALPFPDLDDERLFRVAGLEDRLHHAGG